MKKVFSLLIVTILTISLLTSCDENQSEFEEDTPATLTVANSEEFAKVLTANEDEAYEAFCEFLSKHEYDYIEFDGTVVTWGPPVPSAEGLYMHVAIEDSYAKLYKNGVNWNDLPVTDGATGLNVGAKVHIRGLIVDEDIDIKSIVITKPSEIDDTIIGNNKDEQNETTNSQEQSNSVMVWIPESGTKYHSRKSCSGMENPSQITEERAIELGYTSCSKCH